MRILIFSTLLIIWTSVFAHEGHGPEQKIAPHGGSLKDGKVLMGEMIQEKSGLKIYFFNHDLKPIPASEVKVDPKLTQITDAKKNSVKMEIVSNNEFVQLKFDKNKSYRFNLTLPISFSDKKDQLSWQFEPQEN